MYTLTHGDEMETDDLLRSLTSVLCTQERARQARERVVSACQQAGVLITRPQQIEDQLAHAVEGRATVCIAYTRPNADSTVRNIEPLRIENGLCLAYCHLRQSMRYFNLRRINWLLPTELSMGDLY